MKQHTEHSLKKLFEKTLSDLGIVDGPDGDEKALIPYGELALADDDRLGSQLCDLVAEKTSLFWTLTEFKRLQSSTPEKPIEPKLDDPIFDPPGAKYESELDRKVAKIHRFEQAKIDYEKRTQIHQRLSLQIRDIRASVDFDERGYLATLLSTFQTNFPSFTEEFFFRKRQFWISEKAREKHTFICAGTGSGKSESIKHIIRHYLSKNTKPAIFLLDPHGDLALDVAQFRENASSDRLVYIKPNLFGGHRVSFNPFDLKSKDETSLNIAQLQFLGALSQLIGEKLTPAQRALLTPCLGVLLHKDGTTFSDLIRFMDDDQCRDLVRYGAENLPNKADREFFRDQFFSKNFETTKPALRYRLYELFRDPIVRSFLCEQSTIDIDQYLSESKILVFSFDPKLHSAEAITTIGQLMCAYLVSFAMKRPENKRLPIHLIADECQYFVSPTINQIMGETRKFGLYATLATQRTEQVGREVLDAIMGNVGCYMIGRNKKNTADLMGKEQPITADEIRALPSLTFFQIETDRTPVKTKIDVIGKKFAMKSKEWSTVLDQQRQLYYRPIMEDTETLEDTQFSASVVGRSQKPAFKSKHPLPPTTHLEKK